MLSRVTEVGSGLFDDSVGRVGSGWLELGKLGMETMSRLNVGGSSIRPSHDSLLWRA